ncbi:MAG: hypothetical protein K6G84_00230 [Lachnospiraceae bacterium]|nr:hypothetical protein [Lachnospiraceae bacterium]
MNKKAISLLLAVTMVFSMNTVSFATENTETVETQAQYSSFSDNNLSSKYGKAYDAAQSNNETQSINAAKNGIYFEADYGIPAYIESPAPGKKMTTAKLKDEIGTLTVSVDGYRTLVTDYKITSNSKTPGSTISYKVKTLGGWKYVTKWDASSKRWVSLTSKEAKKGYKVIKAKKSSIKSYVFNSVLEAKTYYGVVSDNLLKSIGKKAVSRNTVTVDQEKNLSGYSDDLRDYLVVTKKNGKIKKVEYITLQAVAETHTDYNYTGEASKDSETSSESSSKAASDSDSRVAKRGYYAANSVDYAQNVKIKRKALKKNKDYTLSGNYVVLNGSRNYYDGIGTTSFEARW